MEDMLGRLYPGEFCSAARTLELVGERWSLLIVRNAMFSDMTRFTEFQRSLGVAPNILTKRLGDFVTAGIFEVRVGEGRHAEYVLTAKGRDLGQVIMALTQWGDRYAAPDGAPIVFEHAGCGGHVAVRTECERCGETPPPRSILARLSARLRAARAHTGEV